jgi:hypothetical protein
VIFSCGPTEAETQTLSSKLWRKDESDCHYFKFTARVHARVKNKHVPIEGPVVFVARADDYWGGEHSLPYRSKVVENPTYRSLFNAAKASQKYTRDMHHSFIEGVGIKGREKLPDGREATVLEMYFGS